MNDSLDLTFAALADPTRRAILARLASGPATAGELAAPFAISQPAISRHLKVLETAGLIETSRAAQSRPRTLKREALDQADQWIATLRHLWPDSFDRLDTMLRDEASNLEERS